MIYQVLISFQEIFYISDNIRFRTIAEIDQKYYLVASLRDRSKGIIVDDLLISVKSLSGLQYEVSLRRRVNNALVRLKLKNGKMVDGAVIEKIGGWL